MAGRIDYAISVSAIQTNSAFEGVTQEAIDAEIGRSLGGGNSSLTWVGSDVSEWSNGTNTMKQADAGTIDTPDQVINGVWVKNSGLTYADQTVKANTDSTVSLTIGAKVAAVLGVGEAIFFPKPVQNETAFITLATGGTDDVAVEYAVFI